MTALESETVIIFNEEDDIAEYYTAAIREYKLLAARGIEPYKIDKTDGKPSGWYYKIQKTAVLIKPANRIIRVGGRRKVKAAASSGAATEHIG